MCTNTCMNPMIIPVITVTRRVKIMTTIVNPATQDITYLTHARLVNYAMQKHTINGTSALDAGVSLRNYFNCDEVAYKTAQFFLQLTSKRPEKYLVLVKSVY